MVQVKILFRLNFFNLGWLWIMAWRQRKLRINLIVGLNNFNLNLILTCYTYTLYIKPVKKKCTFLFECLYVFSTKVLIGDTIFYVSNWRRDRHFTWSSEPREGLACCSAKGVPSFLSYFKTLSIGPAPGIKPATSRSAVNTFYRLSYCRGGTWETKYINTVVLKKQNPCDRKNES